QARYVRAFNSLGWENFANPMPGTNMFFAADPDARAVAEELVTAVGLEPVFVGDASATATVDALLPLWFALVQQNGGNRRGALRVIQEGCFNEPAGCHGPAAVRAAPGWRWPDQALPARPASAGSARCEARRWPVCASARARVCR